MAYPVKGYTLQEQQYIKEIDSEADIYIHEKTKAKLLIIPNDDAHKSFCIGFRTPPSNSTGVAHIIEHSVLCGSKKYPLKDPFVELAKGSLNTYLNAMTYPDKTLYPISSQNDKDFHNLMDVYLDAVFFPKIYDKKEILMQEGWRYHLENPEDPIVYKGVVYNEMKGAFSSQEEIGFRYIKETLFPDTTYKNESGGAPSCIPDLSYEEFLDFHRRYYHPSNSYICIYGNIDVNETLTYIDNEYLSKFDYAPIDSQIKVQSAFNEEIEKHSYYSAAEDKENGLFLSYNMVVGEATDRELMLAMSILEYILLDTPASPLKKALIAEGIGEDVYGAFQTHLRQPIFTIVAKNAKEDKKERFYEVIQNELARIANEGIPEALLKGALQVKEFELRESDSSGYSKGLFYGLAALKSWVYDASPYTYLKYEEEIGNIKAKAYSGYFEGLIKKYLLGNSHAARVILYPKVGLEKEQDEKVTQILAEYKKSLSEEEIQVLVAQTKSFNDFQAQVDPPETLSCIPLLKKEDLRRESTYPRYHTMEKDGTQFIVTPVFTNKIAYINWHIKLEGIEDKYMPYLGMIVGMLSKLDTKNYKYEDLSHVIDENLGSISFAIQGLNDLRSHNKYLPVFQIQSKALVEHIKEQVAIMREIITNTQFDNGERLLEIIREMKALMESSISGDGHRVAYGRLLSHLSSAEAFEEKTKGLTFYHFVCEIEKDWENRKEETIAGLKTAYAYLNNKKRIVVGVTVDEDLTQTVTEEITQGLYGMQEADYSPLQMKFEVSEEKEALIYPSQVNYVATGYNFKEAGYNYNGGLMMLKSILSMDYLWSRVRVQNGAYGCFCDFRRSGNMFFASYRDPNIKETLTIYKEVVDYVANINLSERELVQYLIGTISQLDFPYTPASEGKTAQVYHLVGVKQEEQQASRDELFATTNETLRSFAPMLKACLEQNMYCVFGSPQKVDEAKDLFTEFTTI
nr:insulinase family protein [uncultured Cellulosilyticum sp.]